MEVCSSRTELEHYGQQTKYRWSPDFRVLLEHRHAPSFMYLLQLSCCKSQVESFKQTPCGSQTLKYIQCDPERRKFADLWWSYICSTFPAALLSGANKKTHVKDLPKVKNYTHVSINFISREDDCHEATAISQWLCKIKALICMIQTISRGLQRSMKSFFGA